MSKLPYAERLASLGRLLKQEGYAFCAPTPATHARVLARDRPGADVLRDIFGWNKSFAPEAAPLGLRAWRDDSELFARQPDGRMRALVRFSSLGPLLLAHSAFPTTDADAVFLGPDTYRFAHALRALADREPGFRPASCVDIGAGTGAGALFCATLFPGLAEVALLDINQRALAFAGANVLLNDIPIAAAKHSDILSGRDQPADLIIANPPYLIDPALRAYRHGGGDWGCALAIRILEQALAHLSPGGHLLLYTGSPVVGGTDMFQQAARPVLDGRTLQYRYDEVDPDIFGEELDNPPYDRADRIASVVLHVRGSDLKR